MYKQNKNAKTATVQLFYKDCISGAQKHIPYKSFDPVICAELIRQMIQHTSHPGDLVFVFFMRNSTTAKVAITLGRNVIGFELNPVTNNAILPGIINNNTGIEAGGVDERG